MFDTLVRNWWAFALRGVIAILFGIVAFARPGITLAALVIVFGVFALVDGVMELIASSYLTGTRYVWWAIITGLLGVTAGILTFVYPAATAVALLYVLAAWLIFTGILRVALSVELRSVISDDWILLLSGIAAIGAGVLTAAMPGPGLLAWVWVIGVYAVAYGIILIAVGFRLKQISGSIDLRNAARPI